MRNLVSLGFLASSLFILSPSALAGGVDDCEEDLNRTHSKGLYGLCIAYWHTTNAKARDRILGNYNKKKTDGDPGMPGLNEAACTCWTEDHVIDTINDELVKGTLKACSADGTGWEIASFNRNSLTFIAGETGCFFVHSEDPVPQTSYSSDEAELTCRAQIHELINEFWGVDCTLE